LPVTGHEDQEKYSICLEAEVDIGCAAELKATLIEAVASRKEVRLNLEQVTGLDVTALQLLWAAARAAGQTGVPFSFTGEGRETLTRAAGEMGVDFALAAHSDAAAAQTAATSVEGAE